MEYEIKGNVYDFNCKLMTCMKIKSKFKKNYLEVIDELEKMDPSQLVDLLYCGLDSGKVNYDDFKNHLFDNCGMGDMLDYVMWFVNQLQYPGLSEEEIEKKLMEKKAKAQRLKA